MYHAVKICSFNVKAENKKKCYLKMLKTVDKVISIDAENHFFTFSIDKNDDFFNVSVYANFDYLKEEKSICKVCKEFHCAFYINEQYNCGSCTFKSYLKKLNEKAQYTKKYFKNKLKKI